MQKWRCCSGGQLRNDSRFDAYDRRCNTETGGLAIRSCVVQALLLDIRDDLHRVQWFAATPIFDRAHVKPIVDHLHYQRFVGEETYIGPGDCWTLHRLNQICRWKVELGNRCCRSLMRGIGRWPKPIDIRFVSGRHSQRNPSTVSQKMKSDRVSTARPVQGLFYCIFFAGESSCESP